MADWLASALEDALSCHTPMNLTAQVFRSICGWLLLLNVGLPVAGGAAAAEPPVSGLLRARQTVVSIVGEQFHINGQPTYPGRIWQGHKVEGLLLNSRMVQGIFDDRNPETVKRWAYPDTGKWDADRNTERVPGGHARVAATRFARLHDQPAGRIAGRVFGQSSPGTIRPSRRMVRCGPITSGGWSGFWTAPIELGMVVILGYFYFGQDERLRDEAAVLRATDNATDWLLDHGYRNVLVEINNECNVRYDHPILQPARVHELIQRVQQKGREGQRLLVSTSYGGGTIPLENVVRTADFLLIHGNGVSDPDKIADMVRRTRRVAGYTPKPILFNEDDHFDFDKPSEQFHSGHQRVRFVGLTSIPERTITRTATNLRPSTGG